MAKSSHALAESPLAAVASTTLEAVACEVATLAETCASLEAAVVTLIRHAGPQAAAEHPELQDLDYVTQALHALALFTGRLAAGADRADAAKGLGLAGLEARLGERPTVPVQEHTGRGGVCVLFGD